MPICMPPNMLPTLNMFDASILCTLVHNNLAYIPKMCLNRKFATKGRGHIITAPIIHVSPLTAQRGVSHNYSNHHFILRVYYYLDTIILGKILLSCLWKLN
uniref:Uncharacterized protein n=1 Tax=Cacopsylla melanoneura TaxID=428564 RepID=A0A8D9C0A2_9HEMI